MDEDSTNETPTSSARGTPGEEAPFCWQARAALDAIRNTDSGEVTTGISIYTALTEIASEKGSSVFTVPQADIAAKARVTTKTAGSAIRNLERAGVVKVFRPKLRGPCTYTLLGSSFATNGKDFPALGKHEAPMPSDLYIKELKNSLPSSRFVKPSREEMNLHSTKIGLPASEVERFFNFYESNGWKVGKNPMRDWRAAMNTWKARWEEGRGNKRPPAVNRNEGTANSKRIGQYDGIGRTK